MSENQKNNTEQVEQSAQTNQATATNTVSGKTNEDKLHDGYKEVLDGLKGAAQVAK